MIYAYQFLKAAGRCCHESSKTDLLLLAAVIEIAVETTIITGLLLAYGS